MPGVRLGCFEWRQAAVVSPRYDPVMEHRLRAVGKVDLAHWQVVAPFQTLEDVVRWGGGAIVEIVVQDEYTHDVIAAAGAGFVVFDTT